MNLEELRAIHPVLQFCPIDYAMSAALALQNAGHEPAVPLRVNGRLDETLEWAKRTPEPSAWDPVSTIEDGAEGVALRWVHHNGDWVILRRMRRGEHADWLLHSRKRFQALEVSGTGTSSESSVRLTQKLTQVRRCPLPVERTAVVVAFDEPALHSAIVEES
jgi:hypothetical protein